MWKEFIFGFLRLRKATKKVSYVKRPPSLRKYTRQAVYVYRNLEACSCNHCHRHKRQGLNPLIRSVSRVTAARANASSFFQLLSFLVVCSGMISKGFGFVAFFASVKANHCCRGKTISVTYFESVFLLP